MIAVLIEDLVLRTTIISLKVPYGVVFTLTCIDVGLALDPFRVVLKMLFSYPLS